MEDIFIKILNMSITASYFAIALILIRIVFKKIPGWISCILWGLVGLRLVLPFSFESILSLIPSAETVPADIMFSTTPHISSGIPAFNSVINPVIEESFTPDVSYSVNPLQVIMFILSVLWLTGIVIMLLYALISYILIKRKIRESIKEADGTYICDTIATPFILGIIKPKIFIPTCINEADRPHIIAHEKAHIKRLDHLWKPLGFLILSVYWFNPLMWAAYIFLCRDIEAACDEKVLKTMGAEIKKSYSEALINCSAPRRLVTACPLAFGETGVKQRIKNILSYKKPTLWIIITALVVSIILSVCFMTNPRGTRIDDIKGYEEIFRDVEKLQFFTGENTIKTTEDPAYELRALKKVKINPEPLESDINVYYKIEINDKFAILINRDFEYLQLRDMNYNDTEIVTDTTILSYDDGIRPSSVYKIEDARNIKDFFLSSSQTVIFNQGEDDKSGITDYPGVYITLDSIETNTEGFTFFNVTWHNETDEIITFGESFSTEYDDGTGYIFITPKDAEFNTIAYILKPHTEITHSYSVHGLDISRSGTYRITTGFSPENIGHYITQIVFTLTTSDTSSESSVGGVSGPTAVVTTRKLTLDDVIKLSEKGEDLTWDDFAPYSYAEPTRGTFLPEIVRTYQIDERFRLDVVGNRTEKPYAIDLITPANGVNPHGCRITDDVEAFIKAHEKDPIERSLSFAQWHIPVDNTGENYNCFFENASYSVLPYNRTQYLPVIKIESFNELQSFINKFDGKMNFNGVNGYDGIPFDALCDSYEKEYADFFKNNVLFITYCTTDNTAQYPELGYAVVCENTLNICINQSSSEDNGDDVITGWLVISEVARKDISEVYRVDAFLSETRDTNNNGEKSVLEAYTYLTGDSLDPTFTLYDDGTFEFFFHPLSSYIAVGTYEKTKNMLILTADDGSVYKFTQNIPYRYSFDKKSSAEIPYFADIEDNAVFIRAQ